MRLTTAPSPVVRRRAGRPTIGAVAALAVVALGLAACGNPDATTPGSGGGTVNIYTSVNETSMQQLAKAFSDKFGIKVTYTRLVTGPIVARYTAEATNGTPGADVVILGNEPFFTGGMAKGWFLDLTPANVPNAKNLGSEYQFKGSLGVGLQRLDGIVANSDDVQAGDVPRTWAELTDPKWKGKLTANDPRSIPIVMAEWEALDKKFGDSYLSAIGAQGVSWAASGLAGVQSVAAGERAAMIGANDGFISPLKATAPDAPLTPLGIFTDLHVGYAWNAGVSAKSANSANGLKFVDWLLTPEGQQLFNSASKSPAVLPGVTIAGAQAPEADFVVVGATVDAAEQKRLLGLLGLS